MMDNSVDGSRLYETSPLLRSLSTPIFNEQEAQEKPAFRNASVFSCAVICILFMGLCERVAFYGIIGNMVLFTTQDGHLAMSPETASIIVYVFLGTYYIMCVVGGFLADIKFGRFSVILFCAVIYLIGTILLPIGSVTYKHDEKSDWAANSVTTNLLFQRIVYITGLILVVFGSGGMKANFISFGADQIPNRGPEAIQDFFRWFYWFFNIGALLGLTVVVYVQQNISYFYGNLIPACSFVFAVFFFLASKRTYSNSPPTGSIASTTLHIVAEAVKKSRRPSLSSSFVNHWLDRAKMCFGGSYSSKVVEDVKKVYRLLPLFGALLFYWTVFSQVDTAMIYQGEYMDIHLGSSFNIPIASLGIIDILGVLILIPVLDKLVYPLLTKCNIFPSQLQRIGIGMLLCTAGISCAGIIEWFRVDQCCISQKRGDTNRVEVSRMSILYEVPQYFLISLSEVFTRITGMELAYTEAPESLQGIVMGIFLLMIGLGTYAGATLVAIVNAISGASDSNNKWYPDRSQMNRGHHLSYYYFLLAGLLFLSFILYVFIAISFKAKKESANRANSDANANGLPKHEESRSLPLSRYSSTDNSERRSGSANCFTKI